MPPERDSNQAIQRHKRVRKLRNHLSAFLIEQLLFCDEADLSLCRCVEKRLNGNKVGQFATNFSFFDKNDILSRRETKKN